MLYEFKRSRSLITGPPTHYSPTADRPDPPHCRSPGRRVFILFAFAFLTVRRPLHTNMALSVHNSLVFTYLCAPSCIDPRVATVSL